MQRAIAAEIEAAKRGIQDAIDREPSNIRETSKQVEKFINDFSGEITDVESMCLAIKLAKRFLEENEYTVTSVQYGGFAAPRAMGIVVTVNSKEMLSARTNGKLTEATYRTPFTFQWKFDQPIKIELKANVGWFGEDMKLAALSELKEVEAVNFLRGKTIVLPATPDWTSHSSGGYFIWCKIQEISSDERMAFEKYISPGNYWKLAQ